MYNEITCRLYSCHSYINYTHVSQSSSYIPESAFPLILEGPQFEFTPIYPTAFDCLPQSPVSWMANLSSQL